MAKSDKDHPSKVSREPLHRQVRNLLAKRMETGDWKPGNAVPSKIELSKELDVSSGTVPQALGTLEAERPVIQRQGRGTLVLPKASEEFALRFSNLWSIHGSRITGTMCAPEESTEAANDLERRRLQVGPQNQVVRTRRLRSHEGRPFMYEEASLAVGQFPGLCPDTVGCRTQYFSLHGRASHWS